MKGGQLTLSDPISEIPQFRHYSRFWILQHGGFILDDYLEVMESIANLASKLDRIRIHGYQEGDATPIEDEENIRRHHTRDTVEKQVQ